VNSTWIEVRHPRPAARLRLVCLPFAGGGAGVFRDWAPGLPRHVEVCAVRLPGRERRFEEPAFDRIDPLVSALLEGIGPLLDRPFAFFGHSMGAMIAFELTRRLRALDRQPAGFFASGCRAPHIGLGPLVRHLLPEDEFVASVQKMNGTPPELLENEELMRLVLPTLRSDFAVVETFQFRPQPPFPWPLVAFGGFEDPEVSRDQLAAWSEYAAGTFRMHMLPGDHFFVSSQRARLLDLLHTELEAVSL
jgi:medium-chain acyl-[acyl-carrier-protein] hydrolase